MQRRRHRQRGKRCRPQHRGDPVALRGTFQHRLGQLLDKERHPRRCARRSRRRSRRSARHCRPAFAQRSPSRRRAIGAKLVTWERRPGRWNSGRKVIASSTGSRRTRSTVRSKSSREVGSIQWAPRTPSARPAPRLGCELAEQCLEQFLPLALRAEVESRAELAATTAHSTARYRRHPAPRASSARSLPSFSSTVSSRANRRRVRAAHERIERAVLVMRRAEIAQAVCGSVPMRSESAAVSLDLPITRLARISTRALRRSSPVASGESAARLLVAANERRLPSACLEPAQHPAFPNDPPRRFGSANPASCCGPRSSDRTARRSGVACCRQSPGWPAQRALAPRREVRVCRRPMFCADPSPISIADDHQPVAIPTRACSLVDLISRRPTARSVASRRGPPARHRLRALAG